jgi:hypothetical protein
MELLIHTTITRSGANKPVATIAEDDVVVF